jgi:hypothetical protein
MAVLAHTLAIAETKALSAISNADDVISNRGEPRAAGML